MKIDEKVQEADEVVHTLMTGLYGDTHETYDVLRADAKESIMNINLPTFYKERYNDIIDSEVDDCETFDQGGLSK